MTATTAAQLENYLQGDDGGAIGIKQLLQCAHNKQTLRGPHHHRLELHQHHAAAGGVPCWGGAVQLLWVRQVVNDFDIGFFDFFF